MNIMALFSSSYFFVMPLITTRRKIKNKLENLYFDLKKRVIYQKASFNFFYLLLKKIKEFLFFY